MSTGTGEASFFLRRVRDLVARAPVTCAPAASVADVARLMTEQRAGSVVVLDAAGGVAGIVTDRDLRRRVLAAGRDPRGTSAAAVMTAPVVTTAPGALAFDAVLEMTRRDIHHLPVLEDGRLVGVVSSNDVFRWQATHPVTLGREIAGAPSIADLAAAASHTTLLVRRLVDEGAAALDVARLVAELNDRVIVRALELTAAAQLKAGAGPAPVAYCWLLFGSEARREQTLKTDQDNGLVYADPPEDLRGAAAAWYARFAADAIRALVEVGFPACPGGVMASNPRWCQPAGSWEAQFRRWIDHPSPEEVLDACIFFDLRPLIGATKLAGTLREAIREAAPKSRVFLGLLAHDVAARPVPLTLFGNIATARSGPFRGRVDVKAAGSVQLVGAARVTALELALAETSTVPRFEAAAAAGLYTAAEAREIADAYAHLTRLRLVHQLQRLGAGAPPDNHLEPARLSHADLVLFREALKTVRLVQSGLRARYQTERLG